MTPQLRARFDLVWDAPVVVAVVHTVDDTQAMRNVDRAVAAGADGVFIISHDGDASVVNSAVSTAKRHHPDLWVGANYLTDHLSVDAVVHPGLDGIWVDDALILEGTDDQHAAEWLADRLRAAAPGALIFGGVAFKYGRPVADPAAVAAAASRVVEVVTTSGPATGHAAPIDKLAQVRAGAGAGAVGLASGVTVANVADYLGVVDVFLVATGVSDSFTELNPALLSALCQRVHAER